LVQPTLLFYCSIGEEKKMETVNYDERAYVQYDRTQRLLLRFGSIFNGSFGIAFFLAPYLTLSLLDLTPWTSMGQIPAEPGGIWARLNGIFLIITALFYWLASQNPDRHVGIVSICILGKIWSVFFYGVYILVGGPLGFLTPLVVDLILFFAHLWALGPERVRRVRRAWMQQDL
jgi:hypothetical protein